MIDECAFSIYPFPTKIKQIISLTKDFTRLVKSLSTLLHTSFTRIGNKNKYNKIKLILWIYTIKNNLFSNNVIYTELKYLFMPACMQT